MELGKFHQGPVWADVTAAQSRGQNLYAGVIPWILGFYSDPDDEAGMERREELLAEPTPQDEKNSSTATDTTAEAKALLRTRANR